MTERLRFFFRHVFYNLKGGFLIRPLVMALSLGIIGAGLSSIEAWHPEIGHWVPKFFIPSHIDYAGAQIILSTIASSMMTVVSIVFAILLMTLTLASTQFSPRILMSFSRDIDTQRTLGIYLGTFSYCISALPAARQYPQPNAPVVTLLGAMFLALICVAWLLYFIHHISQAISVNHIVDRVAEETEGIIQSLMPLPRDANVKLIQLPPTDRAAPIVSIRSGYVRYIDYKRLVGIAETHDLLIEVTRRVGHFVPLDVPMAQVRGAAELTSGLEAEILGCFDLGPTRTLEQDIEFGVLQIVDIALKALSPAVNDPSTGVSCVDQLSRILIFFASRQPPQAYHSDTSGVIRVWLPWLNLERLVDSAYQQIRLYSKTDLAVSLRLLRALTDLASTLRLPEDLEMVKRRGRMVYEESKANFPPDALHELMIRLNLLEAVSVATA